MEFIDIKIDFFYGRNQCQPIIFSFYHQNLVTLSYLFLKLGIEK